MKSRSGDAWFSTFVARGGWWVLAQIVVLALAVMIPRWTGHNDFALGSVIEWVGALLTGTGSLLALGGMLSLGRALTPYPRPDDGATLKTGGLYALVRHPLYAGLIIASAGWALWWRSVWGLAFWAAMVVFFDRKAAREESWLEEKFPGYGAYRQRVRKLIPWIY